MRTQIIFAISHTVNWFEEWLKNIILWGTLPLIDFIYLYDKEILIKNQCFVVELLIVYTYVLLKVWLRYEGKQWLKTQGHYFGDDDD